MDIDKDFDGILTKEKIVNYKKAFDRAFEDMKKETSLELKLHSKEMSIIFKNYEKLARCVKERMAKHTRDDFIDSHKICAIFLVSILKEQRVIQVVSDNFNVETGKSASVTTASAQLPYIYFSFLLSIVILEGMYNAKHNTDIEFNVNRNYAKDFVKLIYANQDAIIAPLKRVDCDDTINGIFCLSHIFYFIEENTKKNNRTIK